MQGLRDHIIEPSKDAIKLRLDYFAASKARWLALALLVALVITMLAIPEMNLTGTRWAAFLPALVGYLTGRLSSGVALFNFARTNQPQHIWTDEDNDL